MYMGKDQRSIIHSEIEVVTTSKSFRPMYRPTYIRVYKTVLTYFGKYLESSAATIASRSPSLPSLEMSNQK